MDAIADRRRARARVIEDNAHGLFGRYKGRPLGSWATSLPRFHETRIAAAERRCAGDPRARWSSAPGAAREGRQSGAILPRGCRQYTWVDIGSSFIPRTCWPSSSLSWSAESIQEEGRSGAYAAELADWASGEVRCRLQVDRILLSSLLPDPALGGGTRLLIEHRGRASCRVPLPATHLVHGSGFGYEQGIFRSRKTSAAD
jgi:hypothetical protein